MHRLGFCSTDRESDGIARLRQVYASFCAESLRSYPECLEFIGLNDAGLFQFVLINLREARVSICNSLLFA